MSTPRADDESENEPQGEPRNGPFLRAMRVLAVLSAAVALYALWSVERVDLEDCDLQLATPSAVRPGERFAVRAFLFCGLDAIEGPRLIAWSHERGIGDFTFATQLLDGAGRVLNLLGKSPSELRSSEARTLDGYAFAPEADGEFVVRAEGRADVGQRSLDVRELAIRRRLSVDRAAPAEKVVAREAGPLQQYALGRVRSVGGATSPDRMLPRVVGGACVPERPCTIIVWVGAPAASLTLRAPSNVVVKKSAPVREIEGLAKFIVEVRGLDAELTFEARRAGVLVAERALRLPLALGAAAMLDGPSMVDADGFATEVQRPPLPLEQPPGARWVPLDSAYVVALPPGRTTVTFDAFIDGRWSSTSAPELNLNQDVWPAPDPWRILARPDWLVPSIDKPALVRLQTRIDPFSSEGATARWLYWRDEHTSPTESLTDLARRLESSAYRAWLAPLDEADIPRPSQEWAQQLPAFALEDVQASAAFLLAPAEATIAQVPAPVSGRAPRIARLERTRVRMRYGVAGALALSAWLLALTVARRGLLAVDQAEAIMAEARADDGADAAGSEAARDRINARAKVLLMVLAMGAAFLAGALLIAAKSLWF